MRETITFPRPYQRPLASILLVAFSGALTLVLALPVSIHAGWKTAEVGTLAGGKRAQVTIPAGTILSVETVAEVSTRMRVGTKFETRLKNGLIVGGQLVTPAGTAVYGIVTRSQGGSRSATQRLATTLTDIRWKGHLVPISSDTAGVEVRPGSSGFLKVGGGQMIGAAIAGPAGALAGGIAGSALPRRGSRHITLPAGKELDVHLLLPVTLP
jgi:hypothetical protein